MFEDESNDKLQIESQFKPYGCAMWNGFEINNVHDKRAEIEKWSILCTIIDYVEYNKNHHQIK